MSQRGGRSTNWQRAARTNRSRAERAGGVATVAGIVLVITNINQHYHNKTGKDNGLLLFLREIDSKEHRWQENEVFRPIF
jgi:hypothetical protein